MSQKTKRVPVKFFNDENYHLCNPDIIVHDNHYRLPATVDNRDIATSYLRGAWFLLELNVALILTD